MEEKLITIVSISNICSLGAIERVCRKGYEITGNKFSINFNGSKGYLDNIEISCEGVQKSSTNRIDIHNIKMAYSIYHSEEVGVIIKPSK